MLRPPSAAIVMLVALVLSQVAGAQTVRLHVATNGDDAHDGTKERPFATPRRALEQVRQTATQAQGDVTIVLHDGIYRIARPLIIDGSHALPRGRLVIEAAPGSMPVISGGRAVSGWTRRTDGALIASLPEVKDGHWAFRELFVNGARRPRARHPNQGWARVLAPFSDRRSGFTFDEGALPAGTGRSRLELLFLHDWSTSRVPVASVDHGARSLTVTDPIGPDRPHYRIDHFEKHARFRLENDPALLDAPGEWHLERKTGVLTYRPMPGEGAADLDAVAPAATQLLVVRGAPDQPVRDLVIRGLTFAHCAWSLPAGGYAAGQATFHEDRVTGQGDETRHRIPAAITFTHAEGCVIEGCRVANVGTSAIAFDASTTDCKLVGSVIEDVGGNGVLLGEDTERVVGDRPWWKAAPEQASSGHRVSNNVVQRCGQVLPGAVGIWVGIAHHVQITHNVVRHHPYTGISVGWRWSAEPTPCHHNTVAHNHIHHVMQVLSDGGGIYTLGLQPGSTLHHNHIHDVPLNAGRAGSNGMFLDQGTADMVVAKNLIHAIARSPLRFHQVVSVKVTDNVLVAADKVPAYRYNATREDVVVRKGNKVLAPGAFDPRAADVIGLAASAGLQVAYRHLLR